MMLKIIHFLTSQGNSWRKMSILHFYCNKATLNNFNLGSTNPNVSRVQLKVMTTYSGGEASKRLWEGPRFRCYCIQHESGLLLQVSALIPVLHVLPYRQIRDGGQQRCWGSGCSFERSRSWWFRLGTNPGQIWL